jgi:hypothetical protein
VQTVQKINHNKEITKRHKETANSQIGRYNIHTVKNAHRKSRKEPKMTKLKEIMDACARYQMKVNPGIIKVSKPLRCYNG